jgi:hypothetical protein
MKSRQGHGFCNLQPTGLRWGESVGVLAFRFSVAGLKKIFPDLTYAQGLALLKAAASQLHYGDALNWGTHAFRRGWADEALRNGGPTALFYSGGWRGIAAFSYASAKSRGALAAAEWLVDFSESSGDE